MIIFMGVAGVGKSLQGKRLADDLGLPWLSTGEFLRMLVAGDRRRDMVAGKLLGDQEIIALVQKVFGLVDTSKEFVLDGFPRTVAQADWLLAQVKHGQLQVSLLVHLTATAETVTARLLERGRPDDHAAAITARFQEYEDSVRPILEHFKQAGVKVCDIDGGRSVEEVHQAIASAVQAVL